MRAADPPQCRPHMLAFPKVTSLDIDISQLANGAIPEPVFSGELSVLSLADPEDEEEWVSDYIRAFIDRTASCLIGTCHDEPTVYARVSFHLSFYLI